MKSSASRFGNRLRWSLAVAIAMFAGAALLYPLYRTHMVYAAQEKDSARPASADQATSLSDQTDLAVTVYNSNIALVRDVRQLALPGGAFRLKFMDIAATVNPATVHFRSLNAPEKLSVIEQNYEDDFLDPARLLHRNVGKQVR